MSPSHKSAGFTIDTNDWPLEWRMNLTQHVVSALAFSHYLFSFKIPCFLTLLARAAISKKRREQLGQKRTWTLAFQRS